jgi:DNA-binding MarR family transcriptional regulator
VDAAGDLDDRLLILLSVRKAEPAPDLIEMLGRSRAEIAMALGRLSQAGLVGHHRPEDEPIHWFATPAGKAKGEQLHRSCTAALAEQESKPAAVTAPEATAADTPEHQRVSSRRRVSIDQNEKTGFSWD